VRMLFDIRVGIPHHHREGFPPAKALERGQVAIFSVAPGSPRMPTTVGCEAVDFRAAACAGERCLDPGTCGCVAVVAGRGPRGVRAAQGGLASECRLLGSSPHIDAGGRHLQLVSVGVGKRRWPGASADRPPRSGARWRPMGGSVYWVRALSRSSRAFFWMGVGRAVTVKGMPGAVAISTVFLEFSSVSSRLRAFALFAKEESEVT